MHDKNAPGRRPRLRRGACHVRIEAIELRDFGGELPRIFRESAGDRLLVVVLTSSSALPPPSRLLSGFAVPLRESAAFIRLRSREIAIAATCSRPYPANNARGPRRPRLPVITPVSVNNIVSFWITLDQMPPSLGLVLALSASAACGFAAATSGLARLLRVRELPALTGAGREGAGFPPTSLVAGQGVNDFGNKGALATL
jgi:hypothetical protein